MPGARMLAHALAQTLLHIRDFEQHVAVLRGTLAATAACEAAARAAGRDRDAARIAVEVYEVRAWLLSSAGTWSHHQD